jgi:hypothetical protein
MSNLATLLQDQGKLEEAEPLHRKALELRTKQLGETHPYTLNVQGNLGVVLLKKGESGLGRQLVEATLTALTGKHAMAEEHPWIRKFRQALQ